MTGVMFNAFKVLSILGAIFIVGHTHISYGQVEFHTGAKKSYITIEPKTCVQSIWVSYSKIPRLVTVDGSIFGFAPQSGPIKYTQVSKSNSDEYEDWTQHKWDIGARHLFKLDLGLPTKVDDTILYDTGILTIRNEDGRLQTESVKALLSCNHFATASAIGFDEVTQKFKMPDWLKKPEYIQSKTLANQTMQAPIVSLDSLALAGTIDGSTVATQELPAAMSTPPILPLKGNVLTYEVQLAAFRKEKKAFEHLNDLRIIASYVDSYKPEIQRAKHKSLGVIYRLRLTGVDDKSVAINLCDRLKNDGADCYVP